MMFRHITNLGKYLTGIFSQENSPAATGVLVKNYGLAKVSLSFSSLYSGRLLWSAAMIPYFRM